MSPRSGRTVGADSIPARAAAPPVSAATLVGTRDAFPPSMANRYERPADLAAAIERSPTVPEGDDERFAGYGVMAAPFASGDLLAMRRFPASSLGGGYTSVWHRAPSGEWTIWSDREPLEACPRYFGGALTRAIAAPIELAWPGPRRLAIELPAADLRWTLELASTGTTRLLNALGQAMPDALWRSPRALAVLARVAGAALHAGTLQLAGRAPNGQTFIANPMLLWTIASSRAVLAGRDFGALAPLPEQTRLGDFWLPQRGLFAMGRASFEPLDVTRHRLVSQAPRPAPAEHAPPPPP